VYEVNNTLYELNTTDAISFCYVETFQKRRFMSRSYETFWSSIFFMYLEQIKYQNSYQNQCIKKYRLYVIVIL